MTSVVTCLCGCGKFPPEGKTFLRGHHQKTKKIPNGSRIGSVTVEFLEYRLKSGGRTGAWYTVTCYCGEKYDAPHHHLKRNGGPRCKACMAKLKERAVVGQRYDKLTIVRISGEGKHKMAVCQCDCGGTKLVRAYYLPYQETNNCGCVVPTYEGCGELSKTKYGKILRCAAERDIEVTDLTIELLWKLYNDQRGRCALSGLPISLSRHAAVKDTASLDRIDSDLPYEMKNVQWIDSRINAMKMAMKQDVFISLCRAIGDHNRADENRMVI